MSSAAWALGFVVGLGGVVVGCGNSGNNADAGSGVGGANGTGGGSVTGTGGASTTGTGGASTTGTGGATGGVGGVSGTAGSNGTGGATGTGGRGTGGAPADAGARPDAGGTAMSFFVTSTGSGNMGGNLRGIAGADAKCQSLATAVGRGSSTWHAYLSTSAAPPVHARTRIGNGPWYNARGTMIAASVAQLHDEGGMNALSAANSLDENGAMIPTNQHDMLTGSTVAGMAFPATPDRTCADWT
ncbi:MAG TPA: hypothetical protein VFH68_16840, partial [Polyangia bacterium]|nr:hypothetical protein [Polyangia bacterium]